MTPAVHFQMASKAQHPVRAPTLHVVDDRRATLDVVAVIERHTSAKPLFADRDDLHPSTGVMRKKPRMWPRSEGCCISNFFARRAIRARPKDYGARASTH
jgi:hypothetical protein